uniref:Methyltransferase FkbM domain-containing protein n=1 Tax=Cyclophora tenuis TaxID=216820 RepID=A0A6U1RBR9_CYCTE|mmetsp:Transcript_23781/g.40364  ORF Transcript_23781/g.40364 Transcript_23781/m.40364 type:complete len:246 (+) Transcript_23781:3-740(+)
MRPPERDAEDAPGVYNQTNVTAAVQEILSSSQEGIVMDVGANIGWFTLLSRAMGREVEAFEALRPNVFRMCESLFLNRWTKSTTAGKWDPSTSGVRIYQTAVGGLLERTTLFQVGSHASVMVMRDTNTNATKLVDTDTVTLDHFARGKQWFKTGTSIVLLKINVAGGEGDIIAGASRLLSSKLVKNVIMTAERVDKHWIDTLVEAVFVVHKWGPWTGPDQSLDGDDIYEALKDAPTPLTIWWKRL